MQSIRIVLVGDGKSDGGLDDVPDLLTPIKVPADLCQSDCSAEIVDTWYKQDSDCHDQLISELKSSDVIVLIYDITKPESVERLKSFWCKFISKNCDSPAIIVGNKVDQKPNSESRSLEELMRPIIETYERFEMMLECSATAGINIKEVFQFAQQVVLYPTSPLYKTKTKELTEDYKNALKLVFMRCDRGKRGVLTDSDIIHMHSEVFSAHLNEQDVHRIKEVIQQELPSGVNDSGVTLEGFFQLQKMMIKRQKINVCWNLLRFFGFDKKLKLVIEFNISKSQDQSVELTRAAITHLERVFNHYAENSLLSFQSLFDIFRAVASPPWDPGNNDRAAWRKVFDMVPSVDEGFSLHSWLGLWHLLTLQDYRNSLLYLVYTGCEIPYSELFLTTNEREVMEVNYRRVFCAFVLSDNSELPNLPSHLEGSTWLIQKFIESSSIASDSHSTRWACRLAEESEVLWECKYLVLASFPPGFTGFVSSVKMCDVALILSADGEVPSEEIIPPTVPRVRIKEGLADVLVSRSLRQVFQFAFKPFEGIDDRVREQLMRNRKEKRTYMAQMLGVVGLALGVAIFIIKRKN